MAQDGQLVLNSWRSVEDLILRPPRAQYTRDELLGGTDGEFEVQGLDGVPVQCFRMDVEVREPARAHALGRLPNSPSPS
jgi:hypothetical protein